MAVVPDIFTVFPTDALLDQTLVAGQAGYRYEILDWWLKCSSGTDDVWFYFGNTYLTGRVAAAIKVSSATTAGASPRMIVGGPAASISSQALFIPYDKTLLLGYEGESIGVYSTSSFTWTDSSYVTYRKIEVSPSGI